MGISGSLLCSRTEKTLILRRFLGDTHRSTSSNDAPTYAAENAGALRQNWPRLPLPCDAAGLRASAALGCQVTAILDTEAAVPGATAGSIRPELKPIGVITRT